jgi:hypothetical protein
VSSRTDPAAALRRLRELRRARGPEAARAKLECLRLLERARLGRAAAVLELHDELCFLRAYPDDEAVLAACTRMLAGFARRSDLRRYRHELADTGVAGCDLHAELYYFTADWLARRCPGRLHVDWPAWEGCERLAELLPALLPEHEALAFESTSRELRELVLVLKAPGETDAELLLRRLRRASSNELVREWIADGSGLALCLAPGRGAPSRTLDMLPPGRVEYVQTPRAGSKLPARARIEARTSAARPVAARLARRLVAIGRGALITRGRDLFAFMHADARDVRIADCGGGLQLVYMGLPPARRHLLYGQWVQLALMNGVPVGYVQACTLLGSVEVNFNVFETFRDADAARIFTASLASFRREFGLDACSINTQQLGEDNPEALATGAWWFYYKHGFRPVAPRLQPLVRREAQRKRRDPGYRSSRAVLERLATESLHLFLGRPRRDVVGLVDWSEIGVNVARRVHARCGGGARAERDCAALARRLLDLRDTRGWSPGERLALARWAPLVVALPGIERWSAAQRRALVPLVRAKGAPSEHGFLRLFHAHPRLSRALLQLERRVRHWP